MVFGERFLVSDAFLDGSSSPATWGEECTTLGFAGGVYRFCGLNDRQSAALHGRFGALCLENGTEKPAVECRVYCRERDGFADFDLRGWVYDLDFDFRPSSVRVAGLGFAATLELDPEFRGSLWTCHEDGAEFLSVFENFFRIVAAYHLLATGGVLLHSAGVVIDGLAHLFLGCSGAGKTTIAGLAAEAGLDVLSDDLNAIDVGGGSPAVWQVPFAGDFGQLPPRLEAFELGGVFYLRKGHRHTIRPMSAGSAVAAMVSSASFVNSDPHRFAALAAVLDRIVAAQPSAELTFRRDVGVWRIIEGEG